MTSSYDELKEIAISHKRQRVALIVFAVLLAASTIVTWKAVVALREANEIQKQSLVGSRKAGTPPKVASRRSNAPPVTQASEVHRAPRLAHPGVQKRISERPASIDSAPPPPLASTQALLARPGRQ